MKNITLSDVCRPRQWPTLSKKDMTADGYPVYGANGKIGFSKNYTHESPVLLVGCRGSCGTLHITDEASYANGNAMALDDLNTDIVDINYLFHYLSWRGFDDVVTGSSQPQITQGTLSNITIKIPSLQEQERISIIMETARRLLLKRQEAMRLADEFLRAVFWKFFNEKQKTTQLTEYCEFLSGFAFKSDQYIHPDQGVRLLRGINVGIGHFEWSDAAGYPKNATQELDRYRLELGDVVLAMDRPWISSGLKCAVVDHNVAGNFLVQRVARLRPKKPGFEAFIMQCLQGDSFRAHCRITETTIPHISPKDFSSFMVPTAKESEMALFAQIAEKVKNIKSRLSTSVMLANELTEALRAEFFSR